VIVAILAGCVDPTVYTDPPVLTTEVDDWRDEVVYQLLVDRFADGDVNNDWNVSENPDVLSRYLGGDWEGVVDHVDYLESLGVTAVWVSPIVKNVEEDAGVSSYHGYWTQSFVDVNPHFGDLPAFRRMVDVLHQHGIKVILDIVTNHVGQLFYYDINRNGQPDTTVYGSGGRDPSSFDTDPIEVVTEWDPSYDPRGVQSWTSLGESGPAPLGWVYMPEINRIPPEPAEFQNDDWYNKRGRVVDWNVPEQVLKGDFPGGLKDLDTSNPDVQAALIDVFERWITETNIDGYRIDTVKHVEHGFWQQFNPAMREYAADHGKDNFLQFGEVFDGDDALLGSYTVDGELDSVFYFSQKFQVFDDVFKHGGATQKIQDLYTARGQNYGRSAQDGGIGVPPTAALVNFMDNHDVPRFLFDKSDPAALKSALVYLMTEDGIPCIYYGTEQGFSGGNDPGNREPLWTSAYATDGELFTWTAGLAQLRKTYEPLRRGSFEIKWASDRVGSEEDAHIVAFERASDNGRALVVINTGDDGTSHTSFGGSDMPVGFAGGTRLVAVWPPDDGREFTVSGSGTVNVEVGPREAVVLVPEGDVQ
jgi:alpha-amylase